MADDPTGVWAYGKAEPGWYCAKALWSQAYASHLEEMGYRIVRSIGKPTEDGKPTDAFGKPLIP